MVKFWNYAGIILGVWSGFTFSLGYRLLGFLLIMVAFICQNASDHVKVQKEKERKLYGVLIAEVPPEYLKSNKREDKKRIKQIMKTIKEHENDLIVPTSPDPNVVFKRVKN